MTQEISFKDFIASAIHDMKNSLMMQTTLLEEIAAKCKDNGPPGVETDLASAVFEAKRMNSDLIQLLGVYKFDEDIYPLDIDENGVADVIEEAVAQNRSSLDRKGLSITVDCAPDLLWYLDRDLVSGILLNALNNAYNYTKDQILITANVVDGQLMLRVEDNGRGYPERMLKENGVDADKSISFTSGSTGLGFHFASRAAMLHTNGAKKGSLYIENGGTLGGGCFVVRLP